LNSPRDPAQRGGVVVMDVPNGYDVVKQLSARDILVDYRPGAGIRVAPHFYTKDEEIETVMAEIQTTASALVGV
jgi:kynureninase